MRERIGVLPMSRRLIVFGGAGAVAALALAALFIWSGGFGCTSRDDVTARVAEVSANLQQAAAQGKITVEELATGIRRLNAAATLYQGNSDHGAYCTALGELSDDYEQLGKAAIKTGDST